MSLSGMRSKIDTALATISGLNHYGGVPSVANPPFAFPSLRPQDPVTYDFTAQNSKLVYHFYIEIGINMGGALEQAQDDLDPYLQNTGTTSIKAVIEAINWGTDADVCRVMGVANYGPAMYGGTQFLCARLALDVWV